jgi:integrase
MGRFLEVSSYMENGGNKRFLASIVKHFGTTPLAQIDQLALDRAARKLYPRASQATRNRQFFTPASAVLHHAARRRLCPPPLIERPLEGPERVRWLTPEEAERLLAACADHMRPLVLVLLYTGARAGEALWLDWRDVDLSRAHVSFVKTKNGEKRGVPMHQRMVAALANLPHREGAIFRTHTGEPYARPEPGGGGDTSAGRPISTGFSAAVRRAGLTDFHPHDCRHTWATWQYAANRDLGALKRLGGWKSDRMVLRYAHVNFGELADTIDRLPGGNLGDEKSGKEKASWLQNHAIRSLLPW